jgi:hypothetical protein
MEDGTLRAVAGPDMVVLYTPVHLKGHNLTTVSKFTVSAGEIVPFVLTYAPSRLPPPRPIAPQEALEATELHWHEWASHCRSAGQWSDAVVRSLITLKALTYAPTGGIVAAPTTSLPERFRRIAQLGLSVLLAARRSRCSRCSMPASTTRPRRGTSGCCARLRAVPTRSRSCMGSPANAA